jgi:2-keto-4-pentenoate hydratase/2-oxohepta-3-ene-1,7-dioic acid hydratase in catechol pathway
MRLVTFTAGERTRIGAQVNDEIVDLASAAPSLPGNMRDLLLAGPDGMAAVATAITGAGPRLPISEVHLEAPVPNPSKLLAVGLNYRQHIEETGSTKPDFPIIFNKQVNSVNGPFDPVVYPHVTEQLDYEGELAVIIGRRCRYVSQADALSVVGGYCVINDVSVRDWQRRSPTMTLGKSFDTHAPFGPALVTPDEVGDPHDINHRTFVNTEKRQDSNTKYFLFNIPEIIETLSSVCTLEPGDVIAMGTCAGVALGFDPPKFINVGDKVRIEFDGIGTIENEIVAEPAGTTRIE